MNGCSPSSVGARVGDCELKLLMSSIILLASAAWSPQLVPHAPIHMVSHRSITSPRMEAIAEKLGPNRWEGDEERRPLGQMERLLNARRSWSGAMTTAHVSAVLLEGPPPSEAELQAGLTWALQRHPLLASCVRGKSKYFVPNAEPYPMHEDYLGRAVAYTKELMRTYPDDDIQRFEPSPLPADELAKRALSVVALPEGGGAAALETAWRKGFEEAMDGLILDEDDDGPLWRFTLYAEAGGSSSAIVYAANHAVSDQLSFNRVLSEVLHSIAQSRNGTPLPQPEALPLPPSVEGALLGKEQRQAEEIKERMELIIGQFGEPWGPEIPKDVPLIGGKKLLPKWEMGRVRLSSIKYAVWQMAASGMKVLPTWIPEAERIASEEAKWEHKGRATRNTFRTLDAETTSNLVKACRAKGVSAGAALCAAAVLGASDVMGTRSEDGSEEAQRYKLLQALDMRTLNFGEGESDQPGARDDWSAGTVIAGTGSLDILVDLPPSAGAAARSPGGMAGFWECAAACREQTREWINNGWGRESLLLFSSGWEFMNMNRVVELGSQDRATLGRAYSAGVSNVGVYAHDLTHGDISIKSVYFGISQTVSAPAISTSAVTVDGKLCLTTSYAIPIWPEEKAEAYADDLEQMLRLAAKG